VDDINRNQWPTFSGIGGRFGPESVVDLGRIMHLDALASEGFLVKQKLWRSSYYINSSLFELLQGK
jgi:hypothetical protein